MTQHVFRIGGSLDGRRIAEILIQASDWEDAKTRLQAELVADLEGEHFAVELREETGGETKESKSHKEYLEGEVKRINQLRRTNGHKSG